MEPSGIPPIHQSPVTERKTTATSSVPPTTLTSSNTSQNTATSTRSTTSLSRKVPSLSSYQTTPISKHYELNNSILMAFQSHYDKKIYSVAYAMGLQFVETALLEIPKHGYFYASRHDRERMQQSLEAVRVTQLLKELEGQVEYYEPERVSRLAQLAVEQVNQASEDQHQYQYERRRAQTEAALRGSNNKHSNSSHWKKIIMCEPILAMQESLTSVASAICPQQQHPYDEVDEEQQQQQQVVNKAATSPTSLRRHEPSLKTAEVVIPKDPTPVTTTRRSSYEETSRDSLALIPLARRQTSTSTTAAAVQTISGGNNNNNMYQWSSSSPTTPATPEPPRLVRANGDGGGGGTASSSGWSTAVMPDAPPLFMLDDSSNRPTPTQQYQQRQQQRFSSSSYYYSENDSFTLERALFLSGLEVTATPPPATRSNSVMSYNLLDVVDEQRIPPPPPYDDDDERSSSMTTTAAAAAATTAAALSARTQQQQRQHPQRKSTRSSSLQFHTLALCYHEDFDNLIQTGQIRISYVNTYQGRLSGSTNGCTVIAPLLCIHHLIVEHYHNYNNEQQEEQEQEDPGLLDEVICQVIDEETPVLLRQLRHELGLSQHAFLIPSDVHNHLIHDGRLSQSQFLNVMGGNILDDRHLPSFVEALVKADRRKVAACFFFHEHVVAILKLQQRRRRGNGKAMTTWYDLIDGLPLKETLQRVGEDDDAFASRVSLPTPTQPPTSLSSSSSSLSDYHHHNDINNDYNDYDVSSDGGDTNDDDSLQENYHHHDSSATASTNFIPRTVRIRCLNAQALIACLRWYACSKFSQDNITYIDQYAWDDNLNSTTTCDDFDPRVFQGFVWGSNDNTTTTTDNDADGDSDDKDERLLEI